jgi:5-methylcytosine-specific restriction endonuclease McrA
VSEWASFKWPPGYRHVRAYVLQRDEHECYVCHGRADCVDHLLPRSMGGSNHPNNLKAICSSCNSKRQNNAHMEVTSTIKWEGEDDEGSEVG